MSKIPIKISGPKKINDHKTCGKKKYETTFMVSTINDICINNDRMKIYQDFSQIETKLSLCKDKSLTVSFTERGRKVQVLRLSFDCGLATNTGHDKRRACEGYILFEGDRFFYKFLEIFPRITMIK